MARGITAAIFVVALISSMTILSSIGFYAQLGHGIEVDPETHNEDVVDAAAALGDVDFGEDRDPSILEGPLAAVIPGVDTINLLTTIIGNTSGVVQFLFGAPEVVGSAVERLFQISLLITLAGLVRGAPI